MVLTNSRVLMRKSSNAENMSPHARRVSIKAARKISQSITRHSTSRIRARTTGVKRTKIHKEEALPTPPATPSSVHLPELPNAHPAPLAVPAEQIAMQILTRYPRMLVPPPVAQFGIIRRTSLTWIEPALEGIPLPYIRANLAQAHRGPMMQRVCMGIRIPDLSQTVVPSSIMVQAWNLDSQMPTHMLAVYPMDRANIANARPSVTLYPIHDIIFALHCARWPQCPQIRVNHPTVHGSEIEVPVVRIPLPCPEAFPLLAYYLYVKPTSVITKNLLPQYDPTLLVNLTSEQRKPEVFGAMLSDICTLESLVERAQFMIGFRANLLALGILEGRLWMELCGAWNIVGIAIQHKLEYAA